MKILHVHSGNLFGGVETVLATMARSRLLTPSMEMSAALCFDGQIARELRASGIAVSPIGEVRLRRPDSIRRARRTLAALLRRTVYDAVVCHQAWPHAIFGPVVKDEGLPLVVWVHMAQRGHWLERIAWRVTPDLIICNSRFTASTVPAVTAPVDVIYTPVAPPAARPATAAPGAPLTSRRAIVQVSRMEAWKGQRVCLEALALLRDRTDWECWQVGGAQQPREARYMEALREEARALGIADRVLFLGHRSDVSELLRGAHLFCQPNIEPEPFGISLVESLWHGVPVISSAIGGALEIVDESCGVLTPPNQPSELAASLRRLLDDAEERRRLGRNGPARAGQLCDPARQMPRVAEALARVCAKSGTRAAALN